MSNVEGDLDCLVIFRDIKMRTWLVDSIMPGQTVWMLTGLAFCGKDFQFQQDKG